RKRSKMDRLGTAPKVPPRSRCREAVAVGNSTGISLLWPRFRRNRPMADQSSQTLHIQACLDRIRGGDEAARGELLSSACERLRKLARKILKAYPNVRRWEQTDDVLQNAIIRLHRALQQLPVRTSLDFFRLAALNIRRELLDLARHYYGPQGQGAHHATWDA